MIKKTWMLQRHIIMLRYVTKMLLLLTLLTYVEGRVYCQDSHATKWEPLGYSCPINCANVMNAVKKLQSLDYSRLFSYKNNYINGENNNVYPHNDLYTNTIDETIEVHENNLDVLYNFTDSKDIYGSRKNIKENNINMNPEIKIYKRYYKALNDERVAKDLRNELDTKLKECFSQNKVMKLLSRCKRRSDVEVDFLKKFTSILNRHTHSVPFTEELTAMILMKVLGRNLDLRHGMIDVNKILKFLSRAIQTHEQHMDKGDVINLRSKHCLTINVMGCYCLPGFVEKSGQCVMPSDCFEVAIEKELLARIIVH